MPSWYSVISCFFKHQMLYAFLNSDQSGNQAKNFFQCIYFYKYKYSTLNSEGYPGVHCSKPFLYTVHIGIYVNI